MQAGSLQCVVAACAGELLKGSPATPFTRVCTDSRQLQAGDLFFALPGGKFDGHGFLEEAARKGAAAAVIERGRAPADWQGCALIAVDDTRKALGRLAAHHRAAFSLPVVGVAGSNGKTTTKELLASVLKQKLVTLWSEASFNNDIGVPLTLLRLEAAHQAAVVELGTNHPGELGPLVNMARPDYGIITSIGREHLEFFAGLEGVAREEGRLAELLPATGKLFLNGDDEWTAWLAQRTPATVVRVGFNAGNDWRASGLRATKHGTAFRLEGPRAEFNGQYRIHLLGHHQVCNALFAIALGVELGLSRDELERGLAECKPAKMRLQLSELNGVGVLDDAYNANPDSMLAALQTFQLLPCKGRRVAVLGDMAELGSHSHAAHEELGRQAAELGIAQLFAIGKMAPVMAQGARRAGLNRVLEFGDVEAAAAAVKSFVRSGDVLLLKASRATGLERVAELLRDSPAKSPSKALST
jgi:UDP-N-acetylmuramoyl-tripeptide--D-alanyl-D-alanine ligase